MGFDDISIGDSVCGKADMILLLFVLDEGVLTKDGGDEVFLELALDLRRLRRTSRFIRFAVVCEPELESVSVSLELEESLDELDEFIMSANTPGWDSSSIRCCGVLSYI